MALLVPVFAGEAQAQSGPTNLLVNGDFEVGGGAWPFQDGIAEVQICPGWHAFFVDTPPEGIKPEAWKRPEFRDVKSAEFAYRVHSGFMAQKYFTFGGQHIAGLYQQVGGIQPGTPLRFSIYMQTWGCMAGNDGWNVCPTGTKSNNPAPMHTRVGIDPTGGTSPWGSSVVWSGEINAYDVWTLFQVDAVAQNSTVTVFTYSHADWFDNVFRMHNDVYIDDGSLISLNEIPQQPTTEPPPGPTNTPYPTSTPGPSPTPGPTNTPRGTATPSPDGSIIHVVQAGDTLSGIAEQYNTTVDQITQLNALESTNVLYIGQSLVIAVPSSPLPAATATPEVVVTATVAITATVVVPLPTPTPTPTATPLLPPTNTAMPAVATTSAVVQATVTPAFTSTTGGAETSGMMWVLVGVMAVIIIALLVVLGMLLLNRAPRPKM
ncbi:MAG: LysM peptidoglycan-binding domain-containing protein [Anaerolineae bacterium]|nr:LysM peptidoglycan-binding domain-containing protein [Anaerolineae bacterium]